VRGSQPSRALSFAPKKTAPADLALTGGTLDGKNTISPEDPAVGIAGSLIMPQLGCTVGNIHYQYGGEPTIALMRKSWEDEKRCAF
jgi:hypothetical protein